MLFATYAIDFSSPLMQRHQGRYSRILKTLGKHPVAALTFGAVFALPPVIAGHLLVANTDWSWAEVVAMLFAINVVCITWAAIAGTWFGAQLWQTFARTPRSSTAVRAIATSLVVLTLAVNAYAFGSIGLSVHRKSQLLKCDYDIDLSSIGVTAPELGQLLRGRPRIGLHVDMVIHNPTAFDVELEDNRVVFAHDGTEVGTGRLAPVRVPAGETVRARVDARIDIALGALHKGRDLLSTEGWTVVLYLEVAPGFEFPIYLFE